MDLKKNLEAKLLAVGALVLGLVLAIFVINSYKGASKSSKSVTTPAQATITPPAPAAVPVENLPQGVATVDLNPINDTSVTGSGGNVPGNVPVGQLPGPGTGYIKPIISAPFYPNL